MKASEPATFIHLKVHSAYSLLEGALQIGKIAKLAEANAMPAVALTDTGNLFGALEFSEKLASCGIQPIAGCTIQVDFGDTAVKDGLARPGKGDVAAKLAGGVTLLAKDEPGWANLMQLSSRSYLRDSTELQAPHVTIAELEAWSAGLIALTGGPDGPINSALRAGQETRAAEQLRTLARIFGDRLYVELQRHGVDNEIAIEPRLLALAYRSRLPLVATNEVYFAGPDDHIAHDALICIAGGRYVAEDDRRKLTRNHGFKTQAEMIAVFADLPEAIANTIEIARRCAYRPRTRKPILPQFVATAAGADTQAQVKAEAAELRAQAEAGLRQRLGEAGLAPGVSEPEYWTRLAYEVDVICAMKFPGYFLIVADFIKWAKAQGIPVGPGRGSGAGSLVAWSLTITDLDPLRFGLLFERFLNPERVSMPDFDIDFCQERRDEVIRYVQQKYGADRVAQIITHGKLQARAVLRDVGRVLQMPYGQVDRLCKMVPNNPANPMTLAQAIEVEPKLREARDSEPAVAELLTIALKLEGLFRHASTHAAGVVIGDRPLTELVPMYRDPRSLLPATQFNMKFAELAGLVKFDFLGLKTLTVIQKAVALIKEHGVELNMATLPLDDAKTYALLSRADTAGVFQLESTGMREALKRLRPDRFEDIIAMVSLYRPGPMDNIPTYINRKHGAEKPDYLHAKLEPVLRETYGVIIYQEQVQQIAQALAGYSLGEADLLRRAMGKKIKAEMAQQKSRFVEGALLNDVKKSDAEFIFELVDKFAGYGFNKSHAAAYALVAYHTAYLKANFPVEFFAATMTLDQGNTDKLGMFTSEARRSGIRVLPPSINASQRDFRPEQGAIRYALAALKNIGDQAVDHLVEQRRAGGAFKSLADFAGRFDPAFVNKRMLETLSAAGAFDDLDANRARVHANVEGILTQAQRLAADATAGQNDLFSGGTGNAAGDALDLRAAKPWLPMARLQAEFDAIGFFLSGHPLDEYQSVLQRLGVVSWTQFAAKCETGSVSGLLAAIVVSCRERRSKSGNKFAFGAFSDATGQFEAVLFSDVLAGAGELLEGGTPVLLRVEAERDGETLKVRVQSLESLDKAAASVQRGLKIVIDRPHGLGEIKDVLCERGRGEIRVVVRLEQQAKDVELRLAGRFELSPNRINALRGCAGVLDVQDF